MMKAKQVARPSRARAAVRVPWRAASNEEEARAYLQSRLVVFSSLMFWSFTALLAFLTLLYRLYPALEPANNDTIFAFAGCGLVILAVIWRRYLVRRPLAMPLLNGIDAFYAGGTGVILAAASYLSVDFRPAPYACVLYGCFMVLTRATVVPSSGPRTAVVSGLAMAPYVPAAALIATQGEFDLPATALVCAVFLIGLVVAALAAAGSQTTYGLRKHVTAAMQLGQYTLDRKIGEGGMGVVYHARHALLRRPTAIKLLLPERVGAGMLDRFEREVQHMSQLTHPNTVAVFDYGRSPDGIFYYAMEYLGGVDLERLVHTHGAQPVDRVINILVQVCGALHEAHTSKIIHRDIKPANIILCERGAMVDVAKVVDFGLVKEITTDTGTSTQVILGTPSYVAPEAITDPEQLGSAADLYALGLVGYFLLTGKRVFEGKTAIDICIQHVRSVPVPPSQATATHVSSILDDVIMRCLSKIPTERPSAAALAAQLRAIAPAGDWPEAEATAWWAAFHAREEATQAASSNPTMTITVDVGDRGKLLER
ncbi:MAG: serine/threonine protein kinase [Deltaproteobacteria bacterium]|nr:serine/threonine protein kinase [Deltaproteobacteria bacterium]